MNARILPVGHGLRRYRSALLLFAVLALAALGFFAIHRLLTEVHPGDVRAAFAAIRPTQLAAALALTGLSYLTLTLYDVFALRVIGRPLPWRTAALASFVSYTVSHNFGLGPLTGGSARYRIYSGAGLSAADIARIIATATMTFWAGVGVLAGIALLVHPGDMTIAGFALPVIAQRLAGGAALVVTAALLFYSRRPGRVVHLGRWSLPLPILPHALALLGVAVVDLAAASAALWVLLPDPGAVAFPALFLGYALALVVALASHVPGGVGVFEAVILAAVPDVDKSGLLAALIAYRAIYYLLPLFIAALLVAVREGSRWRLPLTRAIETAESIAGTVTPVLLAALVFVGGAILLVSGALPAETSRLHWLRAVVPLPFVEASHIAASLVGTALLLLAPALYRRLDAAFILTRALLVAGIIFSLVKGVDYEEALLLGVIALLLHWTRGAFYRRTTLTTAIFSPGWLLAIGVVIALSLAIGFFAYKHVDYDNELWWQIAWGSDASRFLRASFAIAVFLSAIAFVRLFRPAVAAAEGEAATPPQVAAILAATDQTYAMLALTGDKRFLLSPEGDAFIMYQIQGQSWIVMGDPVGPQPRWADLLWQLRERADAAQGRLLLYQISPKALPLAIDLGLQLVKYGEEARVDLQSFTLDGPNARPLRYAERRATREGASFDVVSAHNVAALLPELQSVSDAWLLEKRSTEKAFSVGAFDPAYLENFDVAVVRQGGRIVAFANIWTTSGRQELSLDLMRHTSDMPYGTMDFLFVRLMQWGHDNGFAWFNLGLAPLSGIEARRLAPLWARAGAFLYRHGEALYGFEGLRAYKQKFAPVWAPRYIAGPDGVGMARALIDLQNLVGNRRPAVVKRAPSTPKVVPVGLSVNTA
nr:bifunctional lysylphosphatidylglycerol flippase/synthetase MprF [Polymorphobacter arshaanensis]